MLYTASWCAPCQHFKKNHWTKLQHDFAPAVSFVMIDIDENGESKLDSTITSVPTLKIFKGRQLRGTWQTPGADIAEIRANLAEMF